MSSHLQTSRSTALGVPRVFRRRAAVEAPPLSGWRRWSPRPEVILLALALLWTIGAKARVIVGRQPDSFPAALLESTLPDVAFFGIVAALFAAAYAIGARYALLRRSAARVTIIAAGLALIWSVLNAAWLLSTSVQLQPGVLGVLLKDPIQFWPTVQAHLFAKPQYALPIVATILAASIWFAIRIWRPLHLNPARLNLRWVLGVSLAIGLTALITHEIERRTGRMPFAGQVIGFSSHWSAMQSVVGLNGEGDDVTIPQREVPRGGERAVTPPASAPRPNVVIIFLESVSFDSTSLSGRDNVSTPTLEQLAFDGVQFSRTYVPVPQTNKAFFGALTGCTPDIAPDYAESVLVDRPYESLVSILGSVGYRSAFFQMADGAFECGPGLFANLAFDNAWFFENLEDESARVGYLSADDFRMLDPMFRWVDEQPQPFLLTMITTVAHDPYHLPEWFEPDPPENRFPRYLRAVEYNDAFVKEVMNRLEQRGLLENTLLCVMGDHGDSFRPEARRGRFVPFEEVIRVPWVMRWPNGIEPETTVDVMCSQLDLTPTVLSLLGWDISSAGFDGIDASDAVPGRRLYFTSWYKDSPMGFIEGDRKVVYWPYLDCVFEIDLAADPAEKQPATVEDPRKQAIIDDIVSWRQRSQFVIAAKRFRERMLFDHWRTVSSGREAWAYYVP